jgi:hypothetical protein
MAQRTIRAALFSFVVLIVTMRAAGQEVKRPLRVEDCVCLKRITDLKLSPDGMKVAFVVKTPNLRTNENDY